jgi:tetratricopeptide (TPR) repeat protein
MSQAPERRTVLGVAAIIAFAAFGVYANTLSHGFVYDDPKQILSNPWIKDVRHLPDIFQNDVWGFWSEQGVSNYYRPMMHVLYMGVHHVGGDSPWAFHAANVILHVGVSVLVFFVANLLFRTLGNVIALRLSAIAALLFATHPVHTEAVSWVGSLPELSFTLFLLLALYLYMRSTESTAVRAGLYLGSVGCYALSTLCKEPAIGLPLILIAYDLSYRKVHWPRQVGLYLPFLFVALAYLALRSWVLGGLTAPAEGEVASNWQWIVHTPFLFARYLEKLALPVNLNVYYSFHPITSMLEPRSLIGLAAVGGFAVGLWMTFKRSATCFLSLVLISVPLIPVLYIPAIGGTPFGERYLYLPSLGFATLLSVTIFWTAGRLRNAGAMALLITLPILALYSTGTIMRNRVWQDDYRLWSDAVLKSPESDIPHNNLGRAHFARGELDKAIAHYRKSLSLNPAHEEAHNNLGAALATKGVLQEAEQHLLVALGLRRGYSDANNNLGILYGRQGYADRAIHHFREALRTRPGFPDAHHNLGVTYMSKGSLGSAIEHFRTALRLEPEMIKAHLNLATALEEAGLGEEARQHRAQADQLRARLHGR